MTTWRQDEDAEHIYLINTFFATHAPLYRTAAPRLAKFFMVKYIYFTEGVTPKVLSSLRDGFYFYRSGISQKQNKRCRQIKRRYPFFMLTPLGYCVTVTEVKKGQENETEKYHAIGNR